MRIGVDIDGTILYTDNKYNVLSVNQILIDTINNLYYEDNEIVIRW